MKNGAEIASTGQFSAMLAVAQQRLIPSKINDVYGFEMLQAVIRYIPLYVVVSPFSFSFASLE